MAIQDIMKIEVLRRLRKLNDVCHLSELSGSTKTSRNFKVLVDAWLNKKGVHVSLGFPQKTFKGVPKELSPSA